MNNIELKIAHDSMLIERNHIVSAMKEYIDDYCNNMKLDTDYNKGFHDALVTIKGHLTEI